MPRAEDPELHLALHDRGGIEDAAGSLLSPGGDEVDHLVGEVAGQLLEDALPAAVAEHQHAGDGELGLGAGAQKVVDGPAEHEPVVHDVAAGVDALVEHGLIVALSAVEHILPLVAGPGGADKPREGEAGAVAAAVGQVGADEVDTEGFYLPEIRALEAGLLAVSAAEDGAAHTCPGKVSSLEVGPGEVGTLQVLP